MVSTGGIRKPPCTLAKISGIFLPEMDQNGDFKEKVMLTNDNGILVVPQSQSNSTFVSSIVSGVSVQAMVKPSSVIFTCPTSDLRSIAFTTKFPTAKPAGQQI